MSFDHAKAVVRRFNEQVIAGGDRKVFEALIAPGLVNRSAPPGSPAGPESMWNTFQNVLRPALAELSVTIQDQVGEGNKVTTRKTISGKHVGPLLDVEATEGEVSIEVIDIVRIENGRYAEHWGINYLSAVLAGLRHA